MGLLTQYQADAERLARQNKNLARNYSHDVRGLKAEAAPSESVVKDYNAQVEGFKNSAIHNADGSLWEIIGFYGGPSGGVINQPINYPGGWNMPGAPDASSVHRAGIDGKDAGLYRGAGVNSQRMYGYYQWASNDNATLRDSSGAPVRAWQGSMDEVTPVQAYASRNDREFVAPVSQSQIEAAKAADGSLKEIGARGEAMRSEFDASQGLLSRKSDRLEADVTMNKGAISAELAPDTSGSVFDQTKVFQSITDWLKG